MNIPVNTTPIKFFRQLLGLLVNFPPIKGLRPRELDILAEILSYNYELKDIPNDIRSVVIFSTENRKKMCGTLGISEDTLNNNLSILRKSGVITKDNKIVNFLNIIPEDIYKFSVTFNIKEDANR